jgi:hypothetical protein
LVRVLTLAKPVKGEKEEMVVMGGDEDQVQSLMVE